MRNLMSILGIVLIIWAKLFLSYNTVFTQEQQTKLAKEFDLKQATNLGPPVNTSALEFAPTISADGNILIFQSNREGGGFDDVKLYITHKTDDGWSNPVSLDKVNSTAWDGAPFLTYDQNFLLISSRRPGGLGEVDIWRSQRLGDEWTIPVNLGSPINTAGYDGFASLSGDGKSLYFAGEVDNKRKCDRSTSDFDIKVATRSDGNWGNPVALPYPINSDYCESYPVILPDGKTLIFSSTRPGGFGGFDLYKSEKQNDDLWSNPVNLGNFINTPEDECLVSIPASGDIMYFTSGEEDSKDLYSVPIPIEVQPSRVITVTGTVKDTNSKSPLFAEITIIDVGTGTDTTIITSNQVDGKYIVVLNKGKIYDVSVATEGYTFHSTQFDLRELEEFQQYTRDILLEPIQTGTKIVLHNIHFEVDSDSLLDISQYELQRIIKLMNEYPDMMVEIAGHTDNTASEQYNLNLSMRRASSVVHYLAGNGIANERLVAQGYGESQPIAGNDTEADRQKNRRVEFRIIKDR